MFWARCGNASRKLTIPLRHRRRIGRGRGPGSRLCRSRAQIDLAGPRDHHGHPGRLRAFWVVPWKTPQTHADVLGGADGSCENSEIVAKILRYFPSFLDYHLEFT